MALKSGEQARHWIPNYNADVMLRSLEGTVASGRENSIKNKDGKDAPAYLMHCVRIQSALHLRIGLEADNPRQPVRGSSEPKPFRRIVGFMKTIVVVAAQPIVGLMLIALALSA